MGVVGEERRVARGGETALAGDGVGRGLGDSESGQDVTARERMGEFETECCEGTFEE